MSTKTGCLCGGIGRRDRLKICCPQGRVGSSPTRGTKYYNRSNWNGFLLFCKHLCEFDN